MTGTAQILANRQNAERSTGPVTAEGKARVSQKATRFGLFSVSGFVLPEEQAIFAEFESGYLADLAPLSVLEHTLSREIIHAAWRLRRCAALEAAPPADLTGDELERLQISIDRARSAAQRAFHRCLKELRRLQTGQSPRLGAIAETPLETAFETPAANFAEQTQFLPVPPAGVPRSAPCPCGSGEKYKRCCGKTAPPVLNTRAA